MNYKNLFTCCIKISQLWFLVGTASKEIGLTKEPIAGGWCIIKWGTVGSTKNRANTPGVIFLSLHHLSLLQWWCQPERKVFPSSSLQPLLTLTFRLDAEHLKVKIMYHSHIWNFVLKKMLTLMEHLIPLYCRLSKTKRAHVHSFFF